VAPRTPPYERTTGAVNLAPRMHRARPCPNSPASPSFERIAPSEKHWRRTKSGVRLPDGTGEPAQLSPPAAPPEAEYASLLGSVFEPEMQGSGSRVQLWREGNARPEPRTISVTGPSEPNARQQR
jgi:hypothetical protein